jgi:hypothetical protein
MFAKFAITTRIKESLARYGIAAWLAPRAPCSITRNHTRLGSFQIRARMKLGIQIRPRSRNGTSRMTTQNKLISNSSDLPQFDELTPDELELIVGGGTYTTPSGSVYYRVNGVWWVEDVATQSCHKL